MLSVIKNKVNYHFNLSSQSVKRIEKYGTVVQILIPASTALYSLWMKDYSGLAYIGTAFVVNQVSIEVLKRMIPRVRPNGHSLSFPSGHTMATAFGAASLIKRYGIGNIPISFVIISSASVVGVGFSRVIAKAHWISDVIAGSVFGGLIGCLVPRK